MKSNLQSSAFYLLVMRMLELEKAGSDGSRRWGVETAPHIALCTSCPADEVATS